MINHVSYQGRFTRDLELKSTANNVSYVDFTLAWSEKFGDKEVNCFLNCVAYRSTAEFLNKYFDKVHFCGSKKKKEISDSSFIDDDLPF